MSFLNKFKKDQPQLVNYAQPVPAQAEATPKVQGYIFSQPKQQQQPQKQKPMGGMFDYFKKRLGKRRGEQKEDRFRKSGKTKILVQKGRKQVLFQLYTISPIAPVVLPQQQISQPQSSFAHEPIQLTKQMKFESEISFLSLEQIQSSNIDFEKKIVNDIAAPGGARVKQPQQQLSDFVKQCSSLQSQVVGSLLMNMLYQDNSTIQKARVLFAVEELIKKTPKYAKFFECHYQKIANFEPPSDDLLDSLKKSINDIGQALNLSQPLLDQVTKNFHQKNEVQTLVFKNDKELLTFNLQPQTKEQVSDPIGLMDAMPQSEQLGVSYQQKKLNPFEFIKKKNNQEEKQPDLLQDSPVMQQSSQPNKPQQGQQQQKLNSFSFLKKNQPIMPDTQTNLILPSQEPQEEGQLSQPIGTTNQSSINQFVNPQNFQQFPSQTQLNQAQNQQNNAFLPINQQSGNLQFQPQNQSFAQQNIGLANQMSSFQNQINALQQNNGMFISQAAQQNPQFVQFNPQFNGQNLQFSQQQQQAFNQQTPQISQQQYMTYQNQLNLLSQMNPWQTMNTQCFNPYQYSQSQTHQQLEELQFQAFQQNLYQQQMIQQQKIQLGQQAQFIHQSTQPQSNIQKLESELTSMDLKQKQTKKQDDGAFDFIKLQ